MAYKTVGDKKHRFYIPGQTYLDYLEENILPKIRETSGEKFELTPAQIEVTLCDTRFQVLVAGTRFSKSWTFGYKCAMKMILEPIETGKSVRGWVVAPIYNLGEKEFRYIRECLHYAGYTKANGKLKTDISSKASGNYYIEMTNGSSVQVYTAENLPGLLGEEVDFILFSEMPQNRHIEQLWSRYCRGRLTSRMGEAYFPFTPSGINFAKILFSFGRDKYNISCDKCMNKTYCKAICIFPNTEACTFASIYWNWESLGPFSSIEGGSMSIEEFREAEMTLPTEAFQEQYLGLFTPYSGRVYDNFFRNTHVYHPRDEEKLMKISHYRNYEIILGIDWGGVNPSAVVFICKIGQRYFVFDEIYERNMLVDEIANVIKEKLKFWGITRYKAYCDHDWQLEAWMRQEGLYLQQARKVDKKKSILFLKSLLKPQKVKSTGEEMSGIMIAWRCMNLIDEFEIHKYVERQDENLNKKELPEDANDHALDALRYAVFTPQKRLWSKNKKERVR
ncbi:MAG: hypothetical protein KKH44_00400 [Bacteroidetes bacterium]|nr:hypothetical protein [Bacteroidota bacterium]